MTQPTFTATLDAPNLLVMEASGQMDSIAMEIALNMLVPVVKDMRHGGALLRARGVEWPTLGAIGVELRHWAQLMAMIRKVDKIAVLTDQGWVRNLDTDLPNHDHHLVEAMWACQNVERVSEMIFKRVMAPRYIGRPRFGRIRWSLRSA